MPYFNKNHTADYAAAKTGIARGTCQKYWRIWSDKLIENLDSDFIRMQKTSKARGLNALEAIIGNISETVEELKMLNDAHMKRQQALWKKNKTHEVEVNKWLTDKIAKLSKDIFNMEQVKVQIQMKPTADITLQLQISEMLSKVKPEDLQHLLKEAEGKDEK